MTIFDDYLASLPVRIAELKKQLKPLESGVRHMGARYVNSPEWLDETPQQIELLKTTIETYERILSKYEDRDLSNAPTT